MFFTFAQLARVVIPFVGSECVCCNAIRRGGAISRCWASAIACLRYGACIPSVPMVANRIPNVDGGGFDPACSDKTVRE